MGRGIHRRKEERKTKKRQKERVRRRKSVNDGKEEVRKGRRKG